MSQRLRSRGLSVVQSNGNSTSYNLFRLLLKELALEHDKHSPHPQRQPLISSAESWEQIRNMARLPYHLETFMAFGLFSCLNSFLKLVVVLPLKLALDCALLLWALRDTLVNRNAGLARCLRIVNFKNLVFASLIILSIVFANVDTSRIYHTIRAQSSIKLYVMFGVLEVSDKLLSTVGQDLLNYIFSQDPLVLMRGRHPRLIARYTVFYLLSLLYLTAHTTTLVYQTIALNVAANSYSNSLVTLLLSNQFAEIKGSVFKKLDREGLFQMSCADVVERFQLFIMLSIISLRNMVQIGADPNSGLLPNSTLEKFNKWFGVLLGPTTIVIGSELLVDWVKHSYVTKFNKIRPTIYRKYLDIFSSDVIDNFRTQVSSNDPDRVQQRIGLPLPALFVLFIVMSRHSIQWLFVDEQKNIIIPNMIIGIIAYFLLLLIQLLLELGLLKISTILLKRQMSATSSPLKLATSSPQRYMFPDPTSPVLQHVMPNHSSADVQVDDNDDDDYVPGIVSGGLGAIDDSARHKIYEKGETVSPNLNEQRALKDSKSNLDSVVRYRMSSKKIW